MSKALVLKLRANDPNIIGVTLNNRMASKLEGWIFGEALAHNTVVQCLDLRYFDYQATIQLLNELKTNTTLKHLYVNQEGIIPHIMKLRRRNPKYLEQLKSLSARLCNNDDVSILPKFTELNDLTLHSVDHKPVTQALMNVIKMPYVTRLTLDYVSLPSIIGPILTRVAAQLEYLKFDTVEGLTCDMIANILRNGKNLVKFKYGDKEGLRFIQGDTGKIFDVLKSHATLQIFNLSCCEVKVPSLVGVFQHNKALTHVSIHVEEPIVDIDLAISGLFYNSNVIGFDIWDEENVDYKHPEIEDMLDRNRHNLNMRAQSLVRRLLPTL